MLKVAPGFYLIEGPKNGHYPYAHFMFIDDRIQTLLDTGWGRESLQVLGNKKIDLIINSHFHRDHMGNNDAFPGAKVWAHRLDAPAIRSRKTFLEYYGLDFSRTWLDVSQITESAVHFELEDQERIQLGEVELQVIHTPGHSPGHCVFFCPKESLLYGGDMDLAEIGPFYGSTVSSIDDWIASIDKVIALEPRIFISAHRGIIDEDISGCLRRYRGRIYEREARILDGLQKPRTLADLTLLKPINSFKEIGDLFYQIEMLSIAHHLQRLLKSSQISKDGEYYILS